MADIAEQHEAANHPEEEQVEIDFKPIVQLAAVEVHSGEQDEEELLKM